MREVVDELKAWSEAGEEIALATVVETWGSSPRPLGSKNPDPQMAALEEELFDAINQTGIGPQGLGGNTTALAVHIESAWTHITCNPVAVNMQCWRAERRRAKVWAAGKVEIGF